MVNIQSNLSVDDLKEMMLTGNTSISSIPGPQIKERLDQTVNSLLRQPESVYTQDLGDGRIIYVVRNNTIISPNGLYLGGVRWKGYDNEEAALMDANKLARGMSHKWAILNLMLSSMTLENAASIEEVNASRIGGGKSVLHDHHYDLGNFSPIGQPLSEMK
ncbi:MAG: hypothetical protein AABX00_05290 [Nanoarchaeota archaeon]